jgi:hypothetical protein
MSSGGIEPPAHSVDSSVRRCIAVEGERHVLRRLGVPISWSDEGLTGGERYSPEKPVVSWNICELVEGLDYLLYKK